MSKHEALDRENRQCLIICSDDEYQKLQNEELYIIDDNQLITEEEYKREEITEVNVARNGLTTVIHRWPNGIPQTLEDWLYDGCFDKQDHEEYTYQTKSGEVIHAIAKYGYI